MLGLQPLRVFRAYARSPSLSDPPKPPRGFMVGGCHRFCKLCPAAAHRMPSLRAHKMHYAQCRPSSVRPTAHAASNIMNFMQHSRQNLRQPPSLSDPPPARSAVLLSQRQSLSSSAVAPVPQPPVRPRGLPLIFSLTAFTLRLRFCDQQTKNKPFAVKRKS